MHALFNKRKFAFFVTAATWQLAALAQSGSIGGGTLTPDGPRAVEEQSAAVSYSSKSSACSLAKSSASEYAKRKPNIKDMSLGTCDCSSTKKALWLPQQQAQYLRETGQSVGSTTPVDAYECTVTVRMYLK